MHAGRGVDQRGGEWVERELGLGVSGAVAAEIDLRIEEAIPALVKVARDGGGIGLTPGVDADGGRIEVDEAQPEGEQEDQEQERRGTPEAGSGRSAGGRGSLGFDDGPLVPEAAGVG